MMGYYDIQALAGQTFYRAVAAPGLPHQCGYIGIMNPVGSRIRTFVDALYVWPGLPNFLGRGRHHPLRDSV